MVVPNSAKYYHKNIEGTLAQTGFTLCHVATIGSYSEWCEIMKQSTVHQKSSGMSLKGFTGFYTTRMIRIIFLIALAIDQPSSSLANTQNKPQYK